LAFPPDTSPKRRDFNHLPASLNVVTHFYRRKGHLLEERNLRQIGFAASRA